MNKFALPIVAVALACLPLSAYAASLGLNTSAATNTNVTAGQSTTSTNNAMTTNTNVTTGKNRAASSNVGIGVNGGFSEKSSFADVMGSLSTSSASASVDLASIHPKHVKFVLVSSLTGYTAAGLKVSKADAKNMAALDAKIAADAKLTASLSKAGYAPSNVVAVSTDARGDLTLFIAK